MVSFSWATPGGVTSLSPPHRVTSCPQCPCCAGDTLSGSVGADQTPCPRQGASSSSPSACFLASRLAPTFSQGPTGPSPLLQAGCNLGGCHNSLLCFCFRACACRMAFFSYCAPFSVFGSSSSYFQSACVSQALGSC